MGAQAEHRFNPAFRIAYGRDGKLHGLRLLAIAFLAALAVSFGTFVAIVFASTGSPGAIAVWVTIAFLAVKVPLLGLLWWLLGRHLERPGEHHWDDAEAREIMARIRGAAELATHATDAPDRLGKLAIEAWFVADHAPDTVKGEAAALAAEITSWKDAAPNRT